MAVDDVVLERLILLRNEVDYLKTERDDLRLFQEYVENVRLKRAVERSLQVAVEICLDIGRRLISLQWCNYFLAAPTFFTVIDSFPIELIFPIRQGRSAQQVGKKGRDKGRWSVGIKLCWLLNSLGRVVAWDWDTMNVYDKRFNQLA